ncbi:MAG: ATPase, T2SS/T4P/T4SS family, partial [Myxococcota bacterium]|nr:ATPase, T2SS/T4P/T4SS family [Myxococcota bacterium]
MSTSKKPSALLGRLAIQLKMITMDQLAEATAEQGRHPDKRLGEILVAQGCLSEAQLAKLMQVQRDVIAKHRAKKAQEASPLEAAEHVTLPDGQTTISGSGAERMRRAALPIEDVAAPVVEPIAAREPAESTPEQAPPIVAPHVVDDRDSLDLSMGRGQGDSRRLHQLLGDAISAGASDIHIHAGAPLKMRLHGTLADTGSDLFTSEQAEQLALAALSKGEQDELARTGEIDACLTVDGIGRFRLNAYRQQRGFDAVFRAIPAKPPTLEDLGLPNALAKFTNFHQGMVLLTGPSGCGKSATLAALVNMINEERDEHILTVEDPIEYLHPSKRCLVNQRHAGRHT